MIDVGQGAPLLLVPGIQGRWEWMKPAIDVLARTNRVLSFSLDEVPCDATCFQRWDAHITSLLDTRGLAEVTLVGVSFGGVIAARYASAHPDRVASLVLVSAPGPDFRLGPRLESYLRNPTLSLPAFAFHAVLHLLPEVLASQPTWGARATFLVRHLARTLRFPAAPRRMAGWARAWRQRAAASRPATLDVRAPTLVVTGEASLDKVVPVASTLEYLNVIENARHVVLRRTGHLGIVSTPEVFARHVGEFQRELDLQRPGRPD